jgi:hypothetical protein
VLRSRGLRPVVDRDVLTPGGSAMYSTAADMARYMSALRRMGAGQPGSVARALMGAGAEVMIHRSHLVLKPLTPVPAMRRGTRLCPDDPDDARRCSRIKFPEYGTTARRVFSGGADEEPATRLLMDAMSFEKRPDIRNPRRWVNPALLAGATALAVRRRR